MTKSTSINFKITLYSLLVVDGLTIASCEGPAGPQGPEGNANIMYSNWMDIEWDEEGSDEVIKQMPMLESRITQVFLNDGGIVLMFMKFEQNNGTLVYYTLPLIAGIEGSFHYRFITYAGQDEGGITFVLISLEGTAIPDDLWENYQI